MIARLAGEVVGLTDQTAVIDCRGLGLAVAMTARSLARLRLGDRAEVLVHTHVGQDDVRLFGFLQSEERAAFVVLLGVAGVGPRLALALLGDLGAAGLARCVADGDRAALQAVAGVGRRTAERLLVELADRLDAAVATLPEAAPPVARDLHSALCNLGFAPRAAGQAARQALEEAPEGEPLPSLMRRALQAASRADAPSELPWGR